jgi:hypothetical protein
MPGHIVQKRVAFTLATCTTLAKVVKRFIAAVTVYHLSQAQERKEMMLFFVGLFSELPIAF